MKKLPVLVECRLFSVDASFTYLCDDKETIDDGCRVYVPFKNQNVVAYVIKVENTSLSYEEICQNDNINYKFIHKVIDESPILDSELFELAKFLSKEYVTPLIVCLQTILPPTYKPSSSALKEITYKKLKKVFVNLDADTSKLKEKQLAIYNNIKNSNGIFLKDLPVSPIKTLHKNGYVYFNEEIIQEDYFKDYVKQYSSVNLNEEQQKAISTIINEQKDVFLLQGVTGSGKTEVYLELVEHYVNQNKSAIVLVPEISLTPMIIQRFKARFKDIAVLHGSLSAKEKQIQYDKIKNQEVKVVIGARSAVFAPLKNIGIIILDEEQSTSYKQDKAPTYHARDIAIYRAKKLNAKVVLGSATPSFESKARAMKGLYKIVYLRNRANKHALQSVSIINMREEVSDFSSLISYSLD